MTTPFTKQNLISDAGHVVYSPSGRTYAEDNEFVARFKGSIPRKSMKPFMTFLRRNFTVEEYLDRLHTGETPMQIARSKGFIMSHIKAELKKGGYPVTTEGYSQYMKDVQARIAQRVNS